MIYTIYKAYNTINGKSYIGFDSSWPNRMKDHGNRCMTMDSAFYSAIRKHGWMNFVWTVLYQSKDKDHTKNIMEEYFIRDYNSHVNDNGYNMTYGGDGVSGQSDETKWKQGSSNRGKIKGPMSDETKQKIGLANSQKKRTEAEKEHLRQLNIGKKQSDETKLKKSLVLKGRKSNPQAVRALVEKISLDWIVTTPNGQTLEVRNLAKFCIENDLNYKKMQSVGNGKYKQHKGYKVSKSA
jgi:group I intron endonuclease